MIMNEGSLIFAVIGLFYGDEGKGTTVDYLTRSNQASLVVRYNGGPQAAHHVVREDDTYHCFAQFGAGTLIPGVKSFLSKYMFVHPGNLLRENDVLVKGGVPDALGRLFIDKDCFCVTMLHKMMGRLLEISRGAKRHGSCGMGVSRVALELEECLANNIDPRTEMFTIGDALAGEAAFRQKIQRHHEKFFARAQQLVGEYKILQFRNRQKKKRNHDHQTKQKVTEPKWIDKNTSFSPTILAELEKTVSDFSREITVQHLFNEHYTFAQQHEKNIVDGTLFLYDFLKEKKTIVFEGAQGVLLDRRFGFYPYVTKTMCCFDNVMKILGEVGLPYQLQKIGIMRTYGHRHGVGPLVTEIPSSSPFGQHLFERHNSNNPWQGPWRVGYFDVVAIRYALQVAGGVNSVALTHIDYLSSWLEKKLDWKVCISYEYKGSDIELAKRHFDIHLFGPQKDQICVKQIKFDPDLPLNDSSLSGLLLDCVPLQFVNIQNKGTDGKKGVQDMLGLLKSSLGVVPSVLSYGARCNQKTQNIEDFM